jgi:hypothetical protein
MGVGGDRLWLISSVLLTSLLGGALRDALLDPDRSGDRVTPCKPPKDGERVSIMLANGDLAGDGFFFWSLSSNSSNVSRVSGASSSSSTCSKLANVGPMGEKASFNPPGVSMPKDRFEDMLGEPEKRGDRCAFSGDRKMAFFSFSGVVSAFGGEGAGGAKDDSSTGGRAFQEGSWFTGRGMYGGKPNGCCCWYPPKPMKPGWGWGRYMVGWCPGGGGKYAG